MYCQSKKEIRSKIRAQRCALTDTERVAKSRLICTFLIEDLKKRDPGLLFSYLALKEEPDLHFAMEQAKREGWEIYIPYVDSRSAMKAARWNFQLERNELGFMQPQNPEYRDFSEFSLFWVPGVAFDAYGTRLGMGGGFYDRALEDTQSILCGVGWSFQMVSQLLPKESHDIQMDLFISDQGKVEFNF